MPLLLSPYFGGDWLAHTPLHWSATQAWIPPFAAGAAAVLCAVFLFWMISRLVGAGPKEAANRVAHETAGGVAPGAERGETEPSIQEFDVLTAEIFSRLIHPDHETPEAALSGALADIGQRMAADRVYCCVFEKASERAEEWAADGAPRQSQDILEGIGAINPDPRERLKRLESVRYNGSENKGPESKAPGAAGRDIEVSRALFVPIPTDGSLAGFLGLERLGESAPWTDGDVLLAETFGKAFGSALARQNAARGLLEAHAQLNTANRLLREKSADLEETIRERTADLRAQKEQAMEHSRLKSEFLSMISHELRTPLNSILGLAHVVSLKSGSALPKKQSENLGAIITSGHRLLELIDHLLDLSKIESGEHTIHLETLTTDSILAAAEKTIQPLAERKGLRFAILNEAPNAQLHSDKEKIAQILINLLGNAIKFTAEGEVTLSARAMMGGFTFSVADTGIGLEPAEQDVVFERFRQADSSATRQFGGSGLGLTISRHLSQILGGQLSVRSEKGNGSTFTLWVPRIFDGAQNEANGPQETGGR